jgi:hypothetical protein
MSAQETTVFDSIPSIGDNLLAKDGRWELRYTLDKVKRVVDACSNPPYFRGVKTPITDLSDLTETKATKESGVKEKRDQTKDKTSKKPNTQDKTHLSRSPEHEQPAKFPEGLKRPDLEAVDDGKKISSEFQRQLFDDIKRGNFSRCHKGGHNRKDCKDPKAKWEEMFDKEKLLYWTSVLKWQQRAAEQKGTGTSTTTTTKPPTLHVKISKAKPEQRFSVLAHNSDPDDDYEPIVAFRATMHDPDDDDDDFTANTGGHVDVVHNAHDLNAADHLIDDMNDFDMTGEVCRIADPPPHVTAILTAVDAQLRLRILKDTVRARYPHLAYASIDDLLHDPFFTTVFRDPEYSVICFPTGRLTSCLTVNHDRARARYLSPESPVLPQPRRRATPRYDSPPHSPTDDSQDDITYDLSTWSAFSSRPVYDTLSSSSTVDSRPPFRPVSDARLPSPPPTPTPTRNIMCKPLLPLKGEQL